MKKAWWIVVVAGVVCAAPGMGWVEEGQQRRERPEREGGRKERGGPELTDQQIEERKRHLDEELQQHVAKIEGEFTEMVALHTKMKNDRIAFERQMVQDRKLFLDTLKGMKPEERKQAFMAFQHRQEEQRQTFNHKQQEGRQAKRDDRQDHRRDPRDDRKHDRR